MRVKIYFIIGIILFQGWAAAGQEMKVAVFDPAGNVEAAWKEIVREEISSAIVNTDGYIVLERALINKVIEENKFQSGGLVDDEQISEIGKRLGADYVFVTTISPLGKNYYISCKMIEVTTARIEKQKTASTQSGVNDLIETAQYTVLTMFGQNVKRTIPREKIAKPQPDARPRQAERAPSTNDRITSPLTVAGAEVYGNGRILGVSEARALMANTEALRYYNAGLKKRRTGNTISLVGFVAMGAGLGIVLGGGDDETAAIIGGAVSGGGLVIAIPGWIIKGGGTRQIRRAVDIYNSSVSSVPPSDLRLEIGLSSGGFGLALKF